ncbi:hypothetical protein V6N11_059151 [Hibiscus sabdariffa]|uniref:Uncharacterized protein n=1 Tax=Hibiscus sabdariffa TaxID=183260 RepID=A0ABR2U6M3_9ROSI
MLVQLGIELSFAILNVNYASIDEIVHATLFKVKTQVEYDNEIEEHHRNWGNELVQCEGRGATISCDINHYNMITKHQPEKNYHSLLTREEMETPKGVYNVAPSTRPGVSVL